MNIRDFIEGKVTVRCETEEEYRAFLQVIEDEGILWSSGKKPTGHYDYWDGSPIFLCCRTHELLFNRVAEGIDFSHNTISVKHLDMAIRNYRLELRYRLNKVLATLKDEGGFYIKDAIVKYNTKDKPNFEIGKKMAIKKLFDIENENENEKVDVFRASNGFKIESVWSPAFGVDTLVEHKAQLKDKFTDEMFGFVGEIVKAEAYGNIQLHIGDMVELFDSTGQSRGIHPVLDGVKYDDFLLIKRRSYTEIPIGSIVDNIKYVEL